MQTEKNDKGSYSVFSNCFKKKMVYGQLSV